MSDDILDTEDAAFREASRVLKSMERGKYQGGADMRERAAKAVEESMWRAREAIAAEIRALPLDGEPVT